MKTVISFRNFFLNNTPQKAQLIGDLSMILAFLAGLPAFLNEIFVSNGMTIAIPVIVVIISKWCAISLIIVKAITKLIGQKDVSVDTAKS